MSTSSPTVKLPQDVNRKLAPWYGHYTLEQQRSMMTQDLQKHLSELGKEEVFRGLSHTAPYEGYRNSNKFTFGYGAEALNLPNSDPKLSEHMRLGFIGDRYPTCYIIPCDKAITINETFKEICHQVEEVLRGHPFKPFLAPPKTKGKKRRQENYVPHRGVWHSLKVRHSVAEDRYMVFLANFVRHIDEAQRPAYEAALEDLKQKMEGHPKVSVFAVQEYQATLEPQPYDPVRVWLDRSTHQEGTLCESLMDRKFLVSPTSFFQVNTPGAQQLYTRIYQLCERLKQDSPTGKRHVLLDMYCGTGSIGLSVASLFDEIIGIDEVASSIRNAERNRDLNGVKNARYVVGRCEDSIEVLDHLLGKEADYHLYIVVNPSRDGLHRHVRDFLKTRRHQGLIYSSCNVVTWHWDMADLCKEPPAGKSWIRYGLEEASIFDLFPHTPHYEVLSYLRQEPS